MAAPLHTVVQTEAYLRKLDQLGVPSDERERIVDAVAAEPAAGDERIGRYVLKRRVAGRGKGKSGGYRLAVAYFGRDVPAVILALLSKGRQPKFTDAQKKAIDAAAADALASFQSSRRT